MSWLVIVISLILLITMLMILMSVFVNIQDRERYLFIWSVSWIFYAVRYILQLWLLLGNESSILLIFSECASLISGLLFLWGVYTFQERKLSKWWGALGVLGVLWTVGAGIRGASQLWMTAPPYALLAVMLIWTGVSFRRIEGIEDTPRRIARWTFILWGLQKAGYPYFCQNSSALLWGYVVSLLIQLLIAVGVMMLISQRRRRNVSDSESRYRALFEGAADAIFVHDFDGQILEANRVACELLGYPRKDMLTMKIQHITVPDLRNSMQNRIQQIIEQGELSYESAHKTRLGDIIPVEVIAQVIKQGHQEVILKTARDITKRKRAEETLRYSEDKFSKAFHTSPDSVNINRLTDGLFLEINEGFTKLTGYTREDTMGKTSGEINIWDSPDDRTRLVAGLREHGEVRGLEADFRRKDGGITVGLMSARIIEVGGETCILSITRDITDRIRAEQELKRSEERYRAIVEDQTELLCRFLPDGTLTFVNRAFGLYFGDGQESLIGHSVMDFNYGVGPGDIHDHIGSLSPDDPVVNYETTQELNGNVRWASWITRAIFDDQGEVVEYQSVGRDITERKQLDLELKEHRENLEELVHQRTEELVTSNQKLAEEIAERKQVEGALRSAKEAAEAANRAKSAFLANMSHELRTPMNAILGFSQLMRHDTQLSGDHQRNLTTITRSGEHLLSLINEVLELSKIEAGKTTLHIQDFNLHHLLFSLEDIFAYRAGKQGLKLILQLDQDVPNQVRGDNAKLNQVLINLLGNAIKFTGEGSVALRVHPSADPGMQAPDGYRMITFEVQDTGPGIPEEDRQRIFEAFEQVNNQGNFQEGSGLGLAISHQFVNLMNGRLKLDTQEGKGSCFYFTIPIELAFESAMKMAVPVPHSVSLAPDQPVRRVLVVEDIESNRELICELFDSLRDAEQEKGFEIREAIHGQQALEVLETWLPDLIFLDIRMPVMDGYETARRIKKHLQWRNIIIVALTASAFEEDRSRILEAGCDDFVRKPYHEQEILDQLSKHLGTQFIDTEEEQAAAPSPEMPRTQEDGISAESEQAQRIRDLSALLSRLPENQRAELEQHALALNADSILLLAEQIQTQGEVEVSETLRSVVQGFDYRTILAALEMLVD